VRRIIHEHEEMTSALARLRTAEIGEVKVLLPFYIGRILVPPMLARFSAAFPRASIRIFEGAAVDTPRRLAEGEADLGIFYSPPGRLTATSEPVAIEQVYLVGLPDLLGRSGAPITLAAAAAMSLILPSQHTPFRALVETAAQRAGLRLRIEHELELSYAQLAFVLEGKGVAMIPYSHCYEEIERQQIVARLVVAPAISRQILLASGTRAAGRLTRAAFSILKQVIAEHRAAFRWLEPS
jgi:LysR family nitrogen assimilation transcriptional regulator